ncbi:MAG TPA: hypothetical protein VFN97_22505 [Actinospica sp.]|nr:hypothetical protein [Actinospica sp.]
MPGETDPIVAFPVKFSEPSEIEAEPPANAVEVTPLSVEPFLGQTPRIETVCPGEAVPGFTISWPYPLPAEAGPAEENSVAAVIASTVNNEAGSRDFPAWATG